jgi:CPA1 family monovalent cation:H+ antiporter
MIDTLTGFEVAAALMVMTAIFCFINAWVLKTQPTIALVAMGAVVAAILAIADMSVPQIHFIADLEGFLSKVDFRETVLSGMLSFLLFAGALHVDLNDLRLVRWPIILLSTLGVLASMLIVGGGLYLVAAAVGAGSDVPFLYCLAFGALISPTDPVAVLAIMKGKGVPPLVEATVAGESLFNDGVAIAAFTVLSTAAATHGNISFVEAGELFVVEGGGGILLGLLTGWLAFTAMRAIDDYRVELMLSLALVMGGYALAARLGVSGPIAVATAGLVIGNHGVAHAMSETVRDYLLKFWEVLDEILNSTLFLLIGLFAITLFHDVRFFLVGLATIPIVLVARAVSVGAPLPLWRDRLPFKTAFPILVWGGLRGGVSIALVLSLPASGVRDVLLATTYVVVLFSVLGQGMTLAPLIRRLPAEPKPTTA